MRGVRIAVVVSMLAVLALGCAGSDDTGGGGLPQAGATPTGQPAAEVSGDVSSQASSEMPGQMSSQLSSQAVTSTTAPPRTNATAATASTPVEEAARAAAVSFMQQLLGMAEPVAHAFEQTGGDAARVAVRPRAAGELGDPAGELTTVLLKRLADEWAVTGTRTGNIVVDQPAALEVVSSPLRLTGKASAFEGTVQVEVTETRDDKDVVLGTGYVTGRGDGRLGPFEGTIDFSEPTSDRGWVALYTSSAATGQVLEATTVRVRFR